jgi:hypothetical protein
MPPCPTPRHVHHQDVHTAYLDLKANHNMFLDTLYLAIKSLAVRERQKEQRCSQGIVRQSCFR